MNKTEIPKDLLLVPGLVKNNNLDDAWQLLKSHQANRSLDFIYVWQAAVLMKKNEFDDARSILEQGLASADQKHILHYQMGKLHFEKSHMDQAVDSWIRCISSIKAHGADPMWEPLLYLAYTAKGCKKKPLFQQIMVQVEKISPKGRLFLAPDVQKRLFKSLETHDCGVVLKKIQTAWQAFTTDIQAGDLPGVSSPPDSQLQNHHAPGKKPHTWIKNRFVTAAGLIIALILISWVFLKPDAEKSLSLNPPDQKHPSETSFKSNSFQALSAPETKTIPLHSFKEKTDQGQPIPETMQPAEKIIQRPPPIPTAPVPSKKRLPWLKPKTKKTDPNIMKKNPAETTLRTDPAKKG